MRIARTALSVMIVLMAVSYAQVTSRKPTGSTTNTKAASAANTHYYGAVDLGSKGTKGSLYSFVVDEDGRTPVTVFGKTINTKLVSSMQDGEFTKEGIVDAADAAKRVVDAMKEEAKSKDYSVDVYYIVGSSGVAHAKNRADLAAAVKQGTGIEMDFVDAAQEGYYGLLSAVPLSRRSNSMYVDIGSGNTKVGCLVGDTDFHNFKSAEIGFGSVSGRNEGAKRDPKDMNAGIASVMTDVTADYEKQSRDIPCLRNRQRIYWSGGAAWATATYMHPEKELNGWVVITRHDLEVFQQRLKDGTWNQKPLAFHFSENMPAKEQNAIRAKATKEHDDVQNVFVREDLLSGVSIMQAILTASNPSAVIRFVRSGNFIYGYALEKFKADNARETARSRPAADHGTYCLVAASAPPVQSVAFPL